MRDVVGGSKPSGPEVEDRWEHVSERWRRDEALKGELQILRALQCSGVLPTLSLQGQA